MRVVAVLNQKGGVGKTTTAVNLGAALALREERVLLVDLDPQGNLTDHLGIEPGPEQPTAYDVLRAESTVAAAAVPTATPHLFVVPGHEDLAAVELELAGVAGREVRLREALAKLPPQAYDWVLVDCPPSLGLLSLNALAAAREVLLTLQTEYFALRGLGQLDRIVELVRTQINPAIHISGIVPTLVDPVTNLAREVLDEVKRVYGHRVLETRIRKNVRLAEAPGHRQHIFAYAPGSAGAADYHALADELLAQESAAASKASAEGRAGTGKPGSADDPPRAVPSARARIPVAIPVEEPPKAGVMRGASGRFLPAAKPVAVAALPAHALKREAAQVLKREPGPAAPTKAATPAPAAPTKAAPPAPASAAPGKAAPSVLAQPAAAAKPVAPAPAQSTRLSPPAPVPMAAPPRSLPAPNPTRPVGPVSTAVPPAKQAGAPPQRPVTPPPVARLPARPVAAATPAGSPAKPTPNGSANPRA